MELKSFRSYNIVSMSGNAISQHDLDRLLIVMPNWVGDVVLATPTLRRIREQLPGSEITYLLRAYVQDVIAGCPWFDRIEVWPKGCEKNLIGLWRVSQHLKKQGFTCVLLLTNSFRTGLLSWLAHTPRRIGYSRDFRSFLLTNTLKTPRNSDGTYQIESMLTYYARLSEILGCGSPTRPLQLFTDPVSDSVVEGWWREYSIETNRPVVIFNPGSAFGPSKLYPPEHFATVGDLLAARTGAQIIITAGPKDIEIAEKVRHLMKTKAIVLAPPMLNLRLLKSLIAQSDLLITNDTGPRHFAIALNVPVVTIFGSTHPGWTETNSSLERKVMIPVDCGPCQKPVCPLKHRKCMTDLSPEMVVSAAVELLHSHQAIKSEA